MSDTREECRICEGSGKLFMRQTIGFLGQVREITINCWACKGRGFIEHRARNITASVPVLQAGNEGPTPSVPTTPS